MSEVTEGENFAGSLIFLRNLRGAAVSTSGALSESEDLQQSEHCLKKLRKPVLLKKRM